MNRNRPLPSPLLQRRRGKPTYQGIRHSGRRLLGSRSVVRWASISSILCAVTGLITSCSHPQPADSVSGTIETDEVRVASRYGGRVEKIYAQEGQSLTNGQIIAELEASELKEIGRASCRERV